MISRTITINSSNNEASSLGKSINIGAKSMVNHNSPGLKIEFFTETVHVLIGIGKDHTASLIMDKEAWEDLKAGVKVDIDTIQEYRRRLK